VVGVGVGVVLPPDEVTLDLVEPLARGLVDYYEVTPETTWRADARGALVPNGFHRRFLEAGARARVPFVAHGVGLSLAGDAHADRGRNRRWLARIAADQARFRYRWYTDHLGISAPDGQNLGLPLPPPMTAHAAALVRRRLARLGALVPAVGVENTAHYFLLGAPLDEPAFITSVLPGARSHLLLDLHNVHTMAVNMGFDPRRYIERLPLDKVIEIHVSSGSWSRPGWLPSRRRVRLDSHDGDVPDEVWALLAFARPRCRNLRGVTLERIEGTVTAADVPRLRGELRRLRKAVA
jgi:uncharacterized protein (UPF0276 family)